MTIIEAWENQRLEYQKRYDQYVKRYNENPEDKCNMGHMLECSYVLISIFGMTDKQVDEVEKNGGYTNKDLEKL